MQTAAARLQTREAALRTASKIGGGLTPTDVEQTVSVKPEGQTSIIDVTAKGDSANSAAQLANTYAREALELHRERISRQAEAVIADLRRQIRSLPAGTSAADELQARLPQLLAVESGTDPTLALGQGAVPPVEDSGVPAPLLLILSLIVGFAVGTGVAMWADATRRRGATHDELMAAYPIPVLANVPIEGRSSVFRQRDALPAEPEPDAVEAYRTVLAQVHRREHTTLLITSASQDDGKTRASVGLAIVAAAAGLRVAIIDLDLRRPAIGDLLRLPMNDRAEVADLERGASGVVLAPVPSFPRLSALAFREGPLTSLALENGLRDADSLIHEIRHEYDLIVIDTAPLGQVSDALRIVGRADEILIVARPTHTSLGSFARMRDLLERSGHPATGMMVIARTGDAGYGYPYGAGLTAFPGGATASQ
jgi:tyrosine-protein kinase Etk/Wzc